MKKTTLSLFTILSACAFAFAGSSDKGTSSAGFLKLGAGARPVAMGEAYTAAADDSLAVYWNMAALTKVDSRSASFMHASYIASSYFDSLYYAQKAGRGVFGAGIQYFSAGSIKETDLSGAEISNYTPNDLAVTFGYAAKFENTGTIADGFSAGAGLKYIHSQVITSASALAMDLGLLSPAYAGGKLNFGLAVSNFGGKLKFELEKENLPTSLRLGSVYRFSGNFLASADINLPKDNAVFLAAGAEYKYPAGDKNIFLRGGYNGRNTDLGGMAGFNLGAGYQSGKYSFDYAFAPYGDLGSTHRLSFSAKF